MSARRPAADAATRELARRRLQLLGVEPVSSTTPPPRMVPTVPTEPVAPTVPAVADLERRAPAGGRPGRHARSRPGWRGRLAGRAGDALPAPLHGRIRVTAQHVTVVALVLAAAMALAAWLLVRSAPRPVMAAQRASLELPTPAPSVGVPAAPEPSPGDGALAGGVVAASVAAAPAASPAVMVHVFGRVRRPGVVELPAGSRVVDAIEAAGGVRRGARTGPLNLARPLVDGEQIAVGPRALRTAGSLPSGVVTGPIGLPSTAGATAAGGPVDLNTASQAELEELPGVGPVTALSIIEWRTRNGGFSTVDELIEVSGIGEVTLAELRPHVTV